MKQLLSLFLLLCILLTACSSKAPIAEESTEAPTASVTEESTEVSGSSTEEDPTATTEAQPTELEVKTDYSFYTSSEKPKAQYTRRSPEPLTDRL